MRFAANSPGSRIAVNVSRIFTVVAAILLVTAFALMVLPPDGLTLKEGLAQIGPNTPEALMNGVRRTLGDEAWARVFLPLLVRPVWMLPLSLGVVCVGVAASTMPPSESPRRTGRRL
jgi:hypothetical protein